MPTEPTPADLERAREAWYAHGLHIPTAHPPCDSGAPEEWPNLFAAFAQALAAARQQAWNAALDHASEKVDREMAVQDIDEALEIIRGLRIPEEMWEQEEERP